MIPPACFLKKAVTNLLHPFSFALRKPSYKYDKGFGLDLYGSNRDKLRAVMNMTMNH